jgi:hypothetical protein
VGAGFQRWPFEILQTTNDPRQREPGDLAHGSDAAPSRASLAANTRLPRSSRFEPSASHLSRIARVSIIRTGPYRSQPRAVTGKRCQSGFLQSISGRSLSDTFHRSFSTLELGNKLVSFASTLISEKLDGERVYRIVSPQTRKGKAGRTAA